MRRELLHADIVRDREGTRTIDVDFECWYCERPLERERVIADGLLVPRRAGDGGPWLRYDCPTCGIEVRVERNRAGALLAAPPPIVPVVERLIASIDASAWEKYERKRAHAEKRPGRREWFHGAYAAELFAEGRAAPQGAAPPPPRERPKKERPAPRARAAPPPPPRPEPPPPPPPPKPEPAPPPPPPEPAPHEVLGIAAGSPKEEVERAFKELAKRYHPDKFAGLDPEFQALAHEKFKRIAAARDELSQRAAQ